MMNIVETLIALDRECVFNFVLSSIQSLFVCIIINRNVLSGKQKFVLRLPLLCSLLLQVHPRADGTETQRSDLLSLE